MSGMRISRRIRKMYSHFLLHTLMIGACILGFVIMQIRLVGMNPKLYIYNACGGLNLYYLQKIF